MNSSSTIEARYQRAKAALRDTPQNCAAAEEFLLARAQVQHLLEEIFPEPEATATAHQCGRESHDLIQNSGELL